MLLATCRRVLHDGHDAEDICQAAFLLLAQRAASDRWHASVAGWLFQTAYLLSLKARTAAHRRARRETRARPVAQSDPVAELTVRELQAVLDDELSRLPEKYRAPILLCCLEGRSRDEAAHCLGWQLAAVKDRLEQGRERLRVRLARRGVQLGTALVSGWVLEGGARAVGSHLAAQATARTALSIATGQATLAGLLPARVAALATGVTTTMLLRNVIILAVIGLALGLGAAGLVTAIPGQSAPAQAQAPLAKPAPAHAAPVQPQAVSLVGHKGAVRAVAFALDGKAVATGGDDKTARTWDPASGRQIRQLEHAGKALGVAFSTDGKVLAVCSAGKTGSMVLWDLATVKELQPGNASLLKLPGSGYSVAFSPDGKMVMGGLGDCSTALDAASRQFRYNFRGPGGGATAIAFSRDGKILLVGEGTGEVELLDSLNGRVQHAWPARGTVTAMAYLSGSTKVAVADGGTAVRILDWATGAEEAAFEGKDAVRALAITADGKHLATAGASGTILLWDALAGKQERRIAAGDAVHAVALSPDGKRLATAGAGGAVVWDLTRDEKPLPRDLKLSGKELDALWADLASEEGGKAYAAARLLRAVPTASVPFLRLRLQRKAEGPAESKLRQLIADLDAEEFPKREAATRELEKLGRTAESALRAALAADPSPEGKSRLTRLLKRLDGEGQQLTPQQQRDVRAVRVLEQAGTPEARDLLEALAKDSPGWWVAQEAKGALKRLAPPDKEP
jgi:RNA polymerase sigma factor (sigma-70 family)